MITFIKASGKRNYGRQVKRGKMKMPESLWHLSIVSNKS